LNQDRVKSGKKKIRSTLATNSVLGTRCYIKVHLIQLSCSFTNWWG